MIHSNNENLPVLINNNDVFIININHSLRFGIGLAAFRVWLLLAKGGIVRRRALIIPIIIVPRLALVQKSVAAVGAEFDPVAIGAGLVFEFVEQAGSETAVFEVLQ